MTYNKIRHLKLLERFLIYQNQGMDFYTENRNEYLELLGYNCIVSDHIFYKNKQQFILLMEKYINNRIFTHQFELAFSKIWFEIIDLCDNFETDLEELKHFVPDYKSNGFSRFITAVFRQFEVLEDGDCAEEEVKDYVQKTLREIQPYL